MVKQQLHLSSTFKLFLGLAALGLAVVTLQNWAALINSVVLSFIIVLLATPLLYWLQQKGMPNWLAYILTLIVFILGLASLVIFLAVTVNRFLAQVPVYVTEFGQLLNALTLRLSALGIDFTDTTAITSLIEPGRIFGFASEILLSFVNALSNTVLVIFIFAFMLAEAFSLPTKVTRQIQLGNAWCSRATSFNTNIRRYVTITAGLGLLAGVLDTTLLWYIGVDFAVLWGVLSFLLSFVPTIGFWLAVIPPLLLALLKLGATKAIVVLVGFVLINGFVDSILKPKLMGEGLDLSPAVVLLSLMFWGSVLGPLGAILAVPMTMALKELVLEADADNRWIAELMSAHAQVVEEVEEVGEEERGGGPVDQAAV